MQHEHTHTQRERERGTGDLRMGEASRSASLTVDLRDVVTAVVGLNTQLQQLCESLGQGPMTHPQWLSSALSRLPTLPQLEGECAHTHARTHSLTLS